MTGNVFPITLGHPKSHQKPYLNVWKLSKDIFKNRFWGLKMRSEALLALKSCKNHAFHGLSERLGALPVSSPGGRHDRGRQFRHSLRASLFRIFDLGLHFWKNRIFDFFIFIFASFLN